MTCGSHAVSEMTLCYFFYQTTVTVSKNPVTKKVKSDPDVVYSSQEPMNPRASLHYDDTPEPDWFKKAPWQDGWKSKILPTLCLMAGAQTNIWSSRKDWIVSLLTLIIPVVFPDLDIFTCKLTPGQKCVAAVCFLLALA